MAEFHLFAKNIKNRRLKRFVKTAARPKVWILKYLWNIAKVRDSCAKDASITTKMKWSAAIQVDVHQQENSSHSSTQILNSLSTTRAISVSSAMSSLTSLLSIRKNLVIKHIFQILTIQILMICRNTHKLKPFQEHLKVLTQIKYVNWKNGLKKW